MDEVREILCVLCDKIIPIRLKRKFYKAVVRHEMMYRTKCWEVDRKVK